MNIGLIINPVAGIGGSVGLKGSDGAATQTEAQRRGATAKADQRLATMFESTPSICATCGWLSAGGTMGADALRKENISPTVVYEPAPVTRPEDTRQAARRLQAADVDLILFVGGDGTAHALIYGDEGVQALGGVATAAGELAQIMRDVRTGDGNAHELHLGLQTFRAQMEGAQGTDLELARYWIGVLVLERKLRKRPVPLQPQRVG